MATAEVRFMGIHRDTNEGLSPDGECMQLIGATATEDGIKMLEVPKEEHYVEGSFTNIKWFAKGNCYLAIDSAKHLVRFTEGANNSSEQAINSSEQANNPTELEAVDVVGDEQELGIKVTGYEVIGNMICCFTANGIYYVLHKGDEYINLKYAPKTPRLRVSNIAMKVEDSIELQKTPGEGTSREYVSGMCLVAQSLLEKHGYYIDRTFYRVGFKMFDGTYIGVSPIYCCEPTEVQNESVDRQMDRHPLHKIYYLPGLDEQFDLYGLNHGEGSDMLSNPYLTSGLIKDAFNYSMGSATDTMGDNSTRVDVWCGVCGFKPTLKLDYVDLGNWKSIITSIDVFTTGSVKHHKMVTEDDGKERMTYIQKDNYVKEVEQALLTFRKCASFNVNGELGWELENVTPDNLQVQDALSDFNSNNTIVSGDDVKTYAYNSRLHVGNLSEALPHSYELSHFLNYLHIPRQKDDYQYITFGGNWVAFRLHAYDFADFMDVVTNPSNPTESDTYLYRYKAWMSFKATNESTNTYDKRIVYTRHRVDRNGHEEVNRNGSTGGYGTEMQDAFVLDSVHGSNNASRTVQQFYTVTSSNRSTHAAADAIRTAEMFSTIETIGEMETDAGISKIYCSHENAPLIYTTPVVSYPHNLAYKLTAYKKYTGNGYKLVVAGTTYYLVSEFPEIFLDSYYYRWKSANGNELFTPSLTITNQNIYTISGSSEPKLFQILMRFAHTPLRKTPSSQIGISYMSVTKT